MMGQRRENDIKKIKGLNKIFMRELEKNTYSGVHTGEIKWQDIY